MLKIYSQGRIYKITNNKDDLLYVGATVQTLSKRFYEHKRNANRGIKGTLYNHIRSLGVNKFKIVLVEILKDITKEELRSREDYWIKHYDTVKNGLNTKYEDGHICEHKRERSKCKPCGGASICEHQRIRSKCKPCGGASICEHQKQRSQCKDCNGASICEHQRRRSQCKDCNGASICEHKRIRSRCKDCNGDKYKCLLCDKILCSKSDLKRHFKSKKHETLATEAYIQHFPFN